MLALVEDWVAAILPQKGIVRCFLLVQSYTQSQVWTARSACNARKNAGSTLKTLGDDTSGLQTACMVFCR
jgi:hypothetical protein